MVMIMIDMILDLYLVLSFAIGMAILVDMAMSHYKSEGNGYIVLVSIGMSGVITVLIALLEIVL